MGSFDASASGSLRHSKQQHKEEAAERSSSSSSDSIIDDVERSDRCINIQEGFHVV